MPNTIPAALQVLLDSLQSLPDIPLNPHDVRQSSENIASYFTAAKVEMALIQDLDLQLEDRRITTRLYHPDPQTKRPLMVYFHGGGHVSCSIHTHDAICRRIAVNSMCAVLSIAYRLAPEHPYPCGLMDCIAAVEHRKELLKHYLVDTDLVFLAGDSAGGNLAVSVAHHCVQNNTQGIKGLILIYPSLDFSMKYDSFQRYAQGFLLTRKKIQWYFDCYFAQGADRDQASPVHFKHLNKLPPIYLALAEYDPLHDEGITFAQHMQQLDVPVIVEEFEGMTHAFMQLETVVPDQVERLMHAIGDFIKKS